MAVFFVQLDKEWHILSSEALTNSGDAIFRHQHGIWGKLLKLGASLASLAGLLDPEPISKAALTAAGTAGAAAAKGDVLGAAAAGSSGLQDVLTKTHPVPPPGGQLIDSSPGGKESSEKEA